jgi:uncharacterized protein
VKIDVFNHIFTPRYYEALVDLAPGGFYTSRTVMSIRALFDLEERFRIMDEFEGYVQVLTQSSPAFELVAGPEEGAELARISNDEMAELVQRHPDRFVAGVASVPMNNVDFAVEEIDRACGELGLRGVQLFTNVLGRPLDEPEFFPVFERVAAHDLPVFLHPVRGHDFADYASEDRSRYELFYTFGWPYETTATMTRLVCSGMFDRLPDLKVITHHLGGFVPYFDDRIRGTFDQIGVRSPGDEETERDVAQVKSLRRHPLEYFRLFYADTALYGSPQSLPAGLSFFGPERVVFASDMPFDVEHGPKYIRETIGAVEALDADDAVKRDIYEGNARRILKIDD